MFSLFKKAYYWMTKLRSKPFETVNLYYKTIDTDQQLSYRSIDTTQQLYYRSF